MHSLITNDFDNLLYENEVQESQKPGRDNIKNQICECIPGLLGQLEDAYNQEDGRYRKLIESFMQLIFTAQRRNDAMANVYIQKLLTMLQYIPKCVSGDYLDEFIGLLVQKLDTYEYVDDRSASQTMYGLAGVSAWYSYYRIDFIFVLIQQLSTIDTKKSISELNDFMDFVLGGYDRIQNRQLPFYSKHAVSALISSYTLAGEKLDKLKEMMGEFVSYQNKLFTSEASLDPLLVDRDSQEVYWLVIVGNMIRYNKPTTHHPLTLDKLRMILDVLVKHVSQSQDKQETYRQMIVLFSERNLLEGMIKESVSSLGLEEFVKKQLPLIKTLQDRRIS